MVAYSFHKTFADRVERRLKLSTIRGHRKRHARPGEPMQLFTGMRTRACRKLVDPDPVCVGVDEMRFDLRSLEHALPPLNLACAVVTSDVSIEVNGIPIQGIEDLHAFAISDGFGDRVRWKGTGEVVLPFFDMVGFWLEMHGNILFEGVRLRWEHRT